MQDTHFKWLFIVLVSLLILTGFLFFYPNAGQPTAAPHPEYSSILQSTGPYDGTASWLGVIFGLLLVGVIALTSTIGLYRTGTRSKLNSWMIRGIVIYAGVWVLIKFADDIYLTSSSPAFWGGFPLPTALLVYGIGVFPVLIIPFYYLYFGRDIFNESDQEQFNALLKDNADGSGGVE